MKRILYYMIAVLFAAFTACDTQIENIGYQPPPRDVDWDAIRAYHESDHELMFGWFGNWNGGGVSSATSLQSLPDSVDMISIWGEWTNLTDHQKEDMRIVQERGVKVLACMFTPRVGKYFTPEGETAESYWGWSSTDTDMQNESMRRYTEAIVEHALEMGYDGIDMDNEPEDGNVYGNARLTTIFIETVGRYMGPASGTGKLFTIDGYLDAGMNPQNFRYVDYFISQAYYATSYTNYDNRFSNFANFWRSGVDPEGTMTDEEIQRALARKFIVTEDFERHAGDGGPSFTLRPIDGDSRPTTRSSLGLADWKPYYNNQPMQKGGAGLYHIENEYSNSIREYYWTRQMIQIMNPATN